MISWMLFPQHSHVYRQWLTGAILLRRGWCSDGWSGAWLIADVLLTYETWAGTFIIRTSWGGSLLCFWLSVKWFIFFVWQEQHWFFTAFSYMIGFTPYFLQSLWSCCCLMQTNLSDISVTLIFSVFQSFIGSKWHLCDIIRDVFDQPTLCDKNIWDEEIGACYLFVMKTLWTWSWGWEYKTVLPLVFPSGIFVGTMVANNSISDVAIVSTQATVPT